MSKQSPARTLVTNSGALMAVQLLNYLAPLIAIPLLIGRLGIELYAVVAFATTAYYVMSVLVDLGMNLSATYQYSRDQSIETARKLLGVTIAVQGGAFLVVFAVFNFLVTFLGTYSDYRFFITGFAFSALLQGWFPLWYFAAERRLAIASLILTAGKVLYIAILIAGVRGPNDLNYVALAQFVSWALPVLLAYTLIVHRGLRPTAPKWRTITNQIQIGWGFFMSRVGQVAYTTGGTVYLAVLGTPVQLAYYSAVEQGFRAAQGLANAIQRSLFPMMAHEPNFRLLKQALIGMTGAAFVSAGVFAVFADDLLLVVFDANMLPAVPVLMVFLVTITLNVPATIIGYPLFAALQRPEIVNRSVLWAALVAIALYALVWVVGVREAWQVAFVALIVEAFLLTYRAVMAHLVMDSDADRVASA